MQIELIGCTGTGKSTLAESIREACDAEAVDICLGDDFVLGQVGLAWARGRVVRAILLDLCAWLACLATWRTNHEFCRFIFRIVSGLPPTIAWTQKLYILRAALRKIGVYEIIHYRGQERKIILVDEGTLHVAHNLFVHVSVPPDAEKLAELMRLVPLPDVVVHMTDRESVLIQRCLKRVHKRVPQHSFSSAELFVKRALQVFEIVARHPAVAERLLRVDGMANVVVCSPNENRLPLAIALKIVRAGLSRTTQPKITRPASELEYLSTSTQ